MLVLLGIAFLAGVITAVSPCVLPVLPIVLAGGATRQAAGGRSRSSPGLVDELHRLVHARAHVRCSARSGCPQDLLRNLAIALLFVDRGDADLPAVRAARSSGRSRFLTARGGERPRRRLPARLQRSASCSCPCGGPDPRAASRRIAASGRLRLPDDRRDARRTRSARRSPLLAIAARRPAASRAAAPARRAAPADPRSASSSLALPRSRSSFNVDTELHDGAARTTRTSLQKHIGERPPSRANSSARRRARAGAGASQPDCPDYGRRPSFAGGRQLDQLAQAADDAGAARQGRPRSTSGRTRASTACARSRTSRRGTQRYRKDGLVIVGVHTPEFAFEHVAVERRARAVKRLGVRYPVVAGQRLRRPGTRTRTSTGRRST